MSERASERNVCYTTLSLSIRSCSSFSFSSHFLTFVACIPLHICILLFVAAGVTRRAISALRSLPHTHTHTHDNLTVLVDYIYIISIHIFAFAFAERSSVYEQKSHISYI